MGDRAETTEYQSFSKRKSTQGNRTPVEVDEKKDEDELAMNFRHQLINKSEDISGSNVFITK